MLLLGYSLLNEAKLFLGSTPLVKFWNDSYNVNVTKTLNNQTEIIRKSWKFNGVLLNKMKFCFSQLKTCSRIPIVRLSGMFKTFNNVKRWDETPAENTPLTNAVLQAKRNTERAVKLVSKIKFNSRTWHNTRVPVFSQVHTQRLLYCYCIAYILLPVLVAYNTLTFTQSLHPIVDRVWATCLHDFLISLLLLAPCARLVFSSRFWCGLTRSSRSFKVQLDDIPASNRSS